MADISVNNKRIAKNTLMLYVRMFVMMGVNLYTSRIILQALGVDDFGLYNIVGGVVALFTFINSAMVSSTQRFLNYELGRNNLEEAQKVFSTSLNIHIAIAFLFILLAETVGLWFLNSYINIPGGRELAANWVYQFSVITAAIGIVQASYNALIIAHERMSFYAYVSILEVILKLIVAYLVYLFADRLISYSILLSVTALVVFIGYYFFCRKCFSIYRYCFEYNRSRYCTIAGFSGWSLFGAIANMGANQGLNILLNVFFGVAINAAMGIANQVNAAIYHFVSNFQTAFNPQIVKSYAAGEREYFTNLILGTSKYSFFLLFLLALPVFVCCPEILRIWLGQVPDYTIQFCRWMIVFSLIDALQGPLWVSVQATGRIRNYQLLMSFFILLNLPIAYIALKFFELPELVLIVRVFLNVITSIVRIVYIRRLYAFPVSRYMKEVLLIATIVALLSFPIPYIVYHSIPTWYGLLSSIFLALACTIIIIYIVGLKPREKEYFNKVIHKIIQMV